MCIKDPEAQLELENRLWREQLDELAKQFIADLTVIYHYEHGIDDDQIDEDGTCNDGDCFCFEDRHAIAGRMISRGWFRK